MDLRGNRRSSVVLHALVGLAIIGGATVAMSATVAAADLGTAMVSEQVAVADLRGWAPATATPSVPQGQLPSTGRASDGTLTFALLLVGSGVGIVVLSRRTPHT